MWGSKVGLLEYLGSALFPHLNKFHSAKAKQNAEKREGKSGGSHGEDDTDFYTRRLLSESEDSSNNNFSPAPRRSLHEGHELVHEVHELVEEVHMMMFYVMIAFICFVGLMLFHVSRVKKRFVRFEEGGIASRGGLTEEGVTAESSSSTLNFKMSEAIQNTITKY
jgi:hypothetical protein